MRLGRWGWFIALYVLSSAGVTFIAALLWSALSFLK